ncbi:MAG: hypothetical protein KC449_23280 [Anaerolineales bacterium]|nr:hypothetical protein [Anaerolineales bacterium]
MSENPFKEARYILDDYPPHFPPKEYFVDKNKVTKKQLEDFCNLIKSDPGETPIDEFLRKNKEVMANCLSIFNTGHHGAWIIPQQIIRPPSAAARGLIPDYILGGKSSMVFFGGFWI